MRHQRALQQLRDYASKEWENIPSAQEAGRQGMRMEAALRLVLLFHRASIWDDNSRKEWKRLEEQAGMNDGGAPDDECVVSNKRMCDVIRQVLGEDSANG